ncbi:MAG: DUF3108 domain-containing protein [Thalassobaculaceae bacterium]|nr:DUF3108 domain-containing protein [Thalassobaculaceae bacterium]
MKRFLLAFALIALSAPASADTAAMRATYEVYFGGLHILSAESEFSPEGSDYALAAKARTRGILDMFFGWHGETRSAGRYEEGRAVPGIHTNFGWRGDKRRSAVLDYGPDGTVTSAHVDPPPDPDEVTDMPEGAAAGTIDPLTVIAQLSRLVTREGSCSGEFAVFDGRRRYDLRITDRGMEALPPTDYSIFSGEARRCGIEYAMLGGQRKERSKYTETARERVVYVAHPLKDGPPIPVALKIETDFGTLMAHITGIEAPGRLALQDTMPARGSR